MRIGQGYDAHKLVPGNGVILGGVETVSYTHLRAHRDATLSRMPSSA